MWRFNVHRAFAPDTCSWSFVIGKEKLKYWIQFRDLLNLGALCSELCDNQSMRSAKWRWNGRFVLLNWLRFDDHIRKRLDLDLMQLLKQQICNSLYCVNYSTFRLKIIDSRRLPRLELGDLSKFTDLLPACERKYKLKIDHCLTKLKSACDQLQAIMTKLRYWISQSKSFWLVP